MNEGKFVTGRVDWSSFVVVGMTAIVLSFFLTGCRFGNYIEPQKPKDYNGLFATEPVQTQFCIRTEEGSSQSCKFAPASWVRDDLKAIFTNPVEFKFDDGSDILNIRGIVKDPSQGDDTQSFLPVFLNSLNGSVRMNGMYAAVTLWTSDTCLAQLQVNYVGLLEKFFEPSVDTEGNEILGKLSMDIQVTNHFSDGCASSLEEIAACYQDADMCPGDTNDERRSVQVEFAQAMFKNYVDSGVLKFDQFPDLNSISISVYYR